MHVAVSIRRTEYPVDFLVRYGLNTEALNLWQARHEFSEKSSKIVHLGEPT